MILLCDEDIGTRVPKALTLVRLRTISLVQKGWRSWDDSDWLTIAGRRKWLVFSSNKKMLKVTKEYDTICHEKVGIVFLSSGEQYLHKVLRLLLVKWNWLQYINDYEPRPFAYMLYPTGQYKKQSL